jgi:hypothetical protein
MPGFIANLGEFGMRTGDWDDGLTEIEAALGETWEGFDRVGLLASAVGIWVSRGAPVEEGMAELSRLADASDDPQMRSNGAYIAGVVAFAGGDLLKARKEWERAAAMVVGLVPIARARSARAGLWMGDVTAAIGDLAALDDSGFHGAALEADRATIRAGIAALEGRSADALSLYRDALRSWRDLGLAWDEGLCGLDMVLLPRPCRAGGASRRSNGSGDPRPSRSSAVHCPARRGPRWFTGSARQGRVFSERAHGRCRGDDRLTR